ncbi:MAG: alkaline shock response membrane anchor protein AmaP [Clostridia bacterium]|nr:alkaline shock response membrane anchor protein AmaP [Clostridia bacterium]
MKWYDRVLLTVLSVLGAVFGLCLISVAIGWPLSESALRGLTALSQEGPVRLIAAILGAIALLICARLLFVAIKKAGDFKRMAVVVESTEAGQTLLSYNAINAMVLRHVRGNKYVTDCKSEVNETNGVIKLTVRIVTTAEASSAELTRQLQASIKDCVEKNGGIKLGSVDVLVENTLNTRGKRVE